MSEVEQLFGSVQAAHASAEDAHKNNAAAIDLAERIVSAGAAMGFGNDTGLIMAAKHELDTATSGLSAAISAHDDAIRLIAQDRGNLQ